MSGSSLASRVHLPSLAAELPDGWTVSERATLASPSGTEVHLRLERAPEGWNSSDLADQMEAAARAEIAGIDVVTATTVALPGGRVADERRFECDREGVASIGRIVCSVDGGLALTFSASWAASSHVADADVDKAITGLRLLSRPVVNIPTPPDAKGSAVRVKRTPVDVSAWSALRLAWGAANPVEVDVGGATRWSPAELAVCATILGSSSFPTVGPELLASLPEAGLSATLDAVTRSLLARRFVRARHDGSTAFSDELQELMELAVFPDLTISVERLGVDGAGRWWFGLRPDRAVQVTVLPDGSRECGEIEPGRVVAQVLALGARQGTVGDVRAGPERDRVTVEDVIGGVAGVAALVRMSTAWRVGDLIRGGVLTWAVGSDGSLWLAELDATGGSPLWELRSTDVEGLCATLLDHLPGA